MSHEAPRGSEGVVAILLVLAVAAAGCRKAASQDERRETDEPPLVVSGQVPVQTAPPVLPARCPKGGRSIALGDAGVQDDLEIGDVVAYGGGYAVSFARSRGSTRNAAVALLGPDPADTAEVVELGVVVDDAPAPLLARRSADLLAAGYRVPAGRGRADRHRELTIYSLGPDRRVSVLAFFEPSDDSMAFDIASDGRGTVVVWDDASSAGRGVIRGAPVTERGPKVAARDLSPVESDVELPRIVAEEGGYVVLWIARSPEPGSPGDASEVIGETRTLGWLQRLDLDALGVPRGPVRDLTPRSGHVSTYDVKVLGDESVVVARDDGEGVDGSGGAMLRTGWRGGALEPVQKLAVDGVGRGAPAFVDGKPPWLSWTGHDEVLRLLPLDATGSPSGPASSEDFMSDARPLAWRLTSSGAAQWLIATPTAPAGPLRLVECAAAKGP